MKVIKRYANRKLYDTERSCYVTLEDIALMVRNGEDCRIVDKNSNEDLTSVTFAQIIFEEEKRSRRILPLSTLRNIIQTSGEFLQKISLPVQQLKEESQKSVDRLRRGSEVIDEGRQALLKTTQSLQRAIEEMQNRVDERIKDAVGSLTHVPMLTKRLEESLDRLDECERHIGELNKKVEQLQRSKKDSTELKGQTL